MDQRLAGGEFDAGPTLGSGMESPRALHDVRQRRVVGLQGGIGVGEQLRQGTLAAQRHKLVLLPCDQRFEERDSP